MSSRSSQGLEQAFQLSISGNAVGSSLSLPSISGSSKNDCRSRPLLRADRAQVAAREVKESIEGGIAVAESVHQSNAMTTLGTNSQLVCKSQPLPIRGHAHGLVSNQSALSASPAPAAQSATAAPSGMSRAKEWTTEVENAYRFQLAGYKDEREYLEKYDAPQRWESSGFVKCLQAKSTGYYMYFRLSDSVQCTDTMIV